LAYSKADYVFFCEHDVLYHKSHFDFIPTADDVFFYNFNDWRWDYYTDRIIHYNELTSLSQLCVNRKFALDHYQRRQQKIIEWQLDVTRSREPRQGRIWGYEPGTKKTRNGGFSDDKCLTWKSEFPNVDIRHGHTFSKPKTTLDSFKHLPTGWEETTIDKVPGWDLKGLFNL
jgi:hypothetical protein